MSKETKARTDGQCHLCPVAEAVQAGKYSERPFEQTPCFKCRNADFKQFPHRGRSIVSFDVAPPAETAMVAPTEANEECRSIDPFIDFLREFMRLPSLTRDIVGYRLLDLHGERHTYRAIAMRTKVTVQVAEARHRAAMRNIPSLAAMFHGKEMKRLRRAGAN